MYSTLHLHGMYCIYMLYTVYVLCGMRHMLYLYGIYCIDMLHTEYAIYCVQCRIYRVYTVSTWALVT